MEELSFWVGIVASAAFAITGVLAISERGVDLFGVLVLGIITAIGGGTIRDVIMGGASLLGRCTYLYLGCCNCQHHYLLFRVNTFSASVV